MSAVLCRLANEERGRELEDVGFAALMVGGAVWWVGGHDLRMGYGPYFRPGHAAGLTILLCCWPNDSPVDVSNLDILYKRFSAES